MLQHHLLTDSAGTVKPKSMKKICYSTICSSHACPFNLSTQSHHEWQVNFALHSPCWCFILTQAALLKGMLLTQTAVLAAFSFFCQRCIKLTDSSKLKELLKIGYSIQHRFIKLQLKKPNTLNSIYFPDFYWQMV